MAIDKNSNGFTFVFAIVMVVIVGAALSIAAMALKEPQNENVKREKMRDILSAMQVKAEMSEAPELFSKYVKTRIILTADGNVKSEKTGEIDSKDVNDPFNLDIQKQYKEKLAENENLFPLYVCENGGKTYYVIPMVGTGLWGPIWGYLSLESDYKTVFGASFDHKSETPGLGAEIKTEFFTKQFPGEQILDDAGNFTGITVVKGGAPADDKHGVDAITGGTITSKGVEEMLQRTLKVYADYFKKLG